MSVIQSLEISNFQRISAVKIEPTNNVIMLFGQNANGKTSVLDAIETTFCKFNARVTKRPVKDGAGRADIKIKLTDGTELHQKFIPSGPALTGTGPDGKKIGQKDVDQAISSLGVDASAFIHAGEKKQLETLLSIVDLPFVPADLDAQRKAVFDERTGVNRDVKQLEAQHAAFLTLPADLPDEEVSLSDLAGQIDASQNFATNFKEAQDNVTWWDQQITKREAELQELLDQIEQDKGRREVAQARVDEWSTIPAVDVDALREQLSTQEVTNSQIRVAREKKAVAARLATAQDSAEQLTADLAAIDQRKADGLAAVEMPVEGLSFDEEGVLFQGIPFSRASSAEQVIVSLAMLIATDPAVRVAVIRNGNVLDTNSLQIIQDMCEDTNFMVFIEFVSDSEDHEFRIVDGELVA